MLMLVLIGHMVEFAVLALSLGGECLKELVAAQLPMNDMAGLKHHFPFVSNHRETTSSPPSNCTFVIWTNLYQPE